MNQKGFTLIELLAVIVLISIITVIAIPLVKFANGRINEKNFEAKKQLIIQAAEDYGEDYKEIIKYSDFSSTPEVICSVHTTVPCIKISVSNLITNGYLAKDPSEKNNIIRNPKTDASMNSYAIEIYIQHNRAYADLVGTSWN